MENNTVDVNTFQSINKKDYKWPFAKPLSAKPAQPPVKTKPKNFFVKGPVDAYCHCDGHLYDPLLNRYKKLGEKEKLLHGELMELNEEMADVGNEILDHECDSYDDKMETTYQIDYIKRGLNPVQYTKLMPDVDSPAPVPVRPPTISIGEGYRDPTRFRYSTFPRPNINPCPAVTFATLPTTVEGWFAKRTERSEYQDTTSKAGLSLIKSRQQYTQPLPSSRRRIGEMQL